MLIIISGIARIVTVKMRQWKRLRSGDHPSR